VNHELESMGKEVVVALSDVLFGNLCGGTEENNEIPQAGRFFGRDLTMVLPVYKTRVLNTLPRLSVTYC
jgi:hypothetical protein